MKIEISIGFGLVLVIMLVQSCVNHDLSENTPGAHTDEILYLEATTLQGYQYYRSGGTLSPAGNSPHGAFKLRFNDVALQALDETGELPEGSRFPAGSVIVKEVYDGNSLLIYAVMKKATDRYSGDGWLWAEYAIDGKASYSIMNKGNGCTSCHSQRPNRNLVRTFDLH